MATVQSAVPAAGIAPAPAAAGAASVKTTASDIQDRFLKLLVTQLKNQDPLNPMDNAQLTSQLSQISTVSGIEKLNSTISAMSDAFLSAQSLQSTALIGRTVYADGNTLALGAGKTAGGGFQLAGAADNVKVNVIGPAGNVVRQIQLGPQSAGVVSFKWDGLNDGGSSVASGKYSFEVKASSAGVAVNATPLATGAVSGVNFGADGARLNVEGLGELGMHQIKRIN